MEDRISKDVEKFVKDVVNGKNIRATKSLEKIIQAKCANKMKETLKN